MTMKTKLYLKSVFFVLAFIWLILFAAYMITNLSTHDKNLNFKKPVKEEKNIYKDSTAYYKNKLQKCEKWLNEIEKTFIVTATVYNADPRQCNIDCFTTASGFKLNKKDQYHHRIIAVSRDLLDYMPFGTKVLISGTAYDGIYTVQDVMNKRYKKRIDILINKDQKIGLWTGVRVRIL